MPLGSVENPLKGGMLVEIEANPLTGPTAVLPDADAEYEYEYEYVRDSLKLALADNDAEGTPELELDALI